MGLADLKGEGGARSPGGEPDRFMEKKKKKNKDGGGARGGRKCLQML